jgi:hypothetical protein
VGSRRHARLDARRGARLNRRGRRGSPSRAPLVQQRLPPRGHAANDDRRARRRARLV